MTWSFARDKGTPASKWLSKVAPHNQIPIIAVGTVCTFACLLTMIYIGSYTAFNDVISLTITGFYGSYLLPASLLLYHRIKGHVMPHGTDPEELTGAPEGTAAYETEKVATTISSEVGVAQIKLIWGPWHIPGLLGTINNAYACVYMVFVIFWSVWPPVTPVTASTMNYSVVVTGGVLILAGVWYMIRGRHEYKGPLVDTDVVEVMRRSGSIVSVR
jgi:choline transport protein